MEGRIDFFKINVEQCANRWKDFLVIEFTLIRILNIYLIQDR